jgi:hypothetical protein
MPIHSPKPSKSSQLSGQFAPRVVAAGMEGRQSDAQGGGGLMSLRAANVDRGLAGIKPPYTSGLWHPFGDDGAVA